VKKKKKKKKKKKSNLIQQKYIGDSTINEYKQLGELPINQPVNEKPRTKKRKRKKERKQQKGTHGLSVVPGKASVDVERETGCEVNGGDAETRRESLECPISCLTRYPHLSLCCSASLFQAFFAVCTRLRLCPVSLRRQLT
jgi:hypothetical protein